jgi:hypothetical protein
MITLETIAKVMFGYHIGLRFRNGWYIAECREIGISEDGRTIMSAVVALTRSVFEWIKVGSSEDLPRPMFM